MSVWNADERFVLLPCGDTHNLKNQIYSNAPSGSSSWGIQGRTFQPSPDSGLDGQRYSYSSSGLYMYGKEEQGRLGFVRCIQGDVWGGLHRPSNRVPWHTPLPLPIHGKTLMVGLDFYNDTSRLSHTSNAWIMFAINVWVSAPSFPKADNDRNGKKPLVLDLAFFHASHGGAQLRSHESGVAYHYQTLVGNTPEKQGHCYFFNLSRYIEQALRAFSLWSQPTDAKLYQLEFLIELKNAEGAAKISHFCLQY
jgi:hypothetical protein